MNPTQHQCGHHLGPLRPIPGFLRVVGHNLGRRIPIFRVSRINRIVEEGWVELGETPRLKIHLRRVFSPLRQTIRVDDPPEIVILRLVLKFARDCLRPVDVGHVPIQLILQILQKLICDHFFSQRHHHLSSALQPCHHILHVLQCTVTILAASQQVTISVLPGPHPIAIQKRTDEVHSRAVMLKAVGSISSVDRQLIVPSHGIGPRSVQRERTRADATHMVA
mmetsp:Transcript_231/g.519  ORF Transcript_231/g.519 Transcript_231/m.519 type:complete len:222 (-) Transcript_231:774-1439(-)